MLATAAAIPRSAPWHFAPPLPELRYWVLPGQLLAGEHPSGARTPKPPAGVWSQLLAAGVECFIDLTDPGEIEPYDRRFPFSIEYLRKPIRDHGLPGGAST